MARYIDVEGYRKLFDEEYKKTRKLISNGETHLDNLAEGFSEASRVIDGMPTADVVPKSEVERWCNIIKAIGVYVDLFRESERESEDEDRTPKYFSPAEVHKMTPREVKANYDDIINSMKEW